MVGSHSLPIRRAKEALVREPRRGVIAHAQNFIGQRTPALRNSGACVTHPRPVWALLREKKAACPAQPVQHDGSRKRFLCGQLSWSSHRWLIQSFGCPFKVRLTVRGDLVSGSRSILEAWMINV